MIRYGAVTGPLERDPWGTFRYVRVGGKTAYDDDVYSSLKDAPIFPSMMRKHLPVWPDGKEHGKLDEQGMFLAGQIASEPTIRRPTGSCSTASTTRSRSTRPRSNRTTRTAGTTPRRSRCTVVPTQSPLEVAENAAAMVAKCRFPVKKLFVHPCYTVGYGSKDHFNVPFYGLVCALYADGRPVRFANDRYEQFQTSLKRHAFKMHYRIAVDRNTGLLQSFKGDFEANGGGRSNFSPSVAMVGATAAQSIYYFPKERPRSRSRRARSMPARHVATARCRAWRRPRWRSTRSPRS